MQLKRITVCVMVVVLICFSTIVRVSAVESDSFDITAEVVPSAAMSENPVVLKQGEEFIIRVTIRSNPEIEVAQIAVNFDNTAITPKLDADEKPVYTVGTAFQKYQVTKTSKKVTIIIDAFDDPIEASEEEWLVIEYTFVVSDTFDGATGISITADDVDFSYTSATPAPVININDMNTEGYNGADLLVHDYVSHEAKAATCTEKGWNAYLTCADCDFTSYVEIPATGHSYVDVVTAPTCTEEGFTTHTCSVCDDSYVDTTVEATGHTLSDWIVDTEATCTAAGSKHKTCTVCEETVETVEIPATGHSYVDVVTAPTCTEEGFTTHTCSVCEDSYVDTTVEATGHNYSDWADAANGKHVHTCEKCSLSEYEDHVFGDLAVTAQPTETSEGAGTYTCETCESVKEVVIPALSTENGYTRTVVKEATEAEEGQIEWNHSEYGKFFTSIAKIEPILLDVRTIEGKGTYADGKITTSQESNLADFVSGNVKAFRGEEEVTGIIATGDIVKLYNESGDVIDTATVIVKGDVFADGKVTIIDAIQLRLYILGTELNDAQLLAADASGDGNVNVLDFIQIRLCLLGLAEIN